MRSEIIRVINIIVILLLAGLNSSALPFLETPTVSDEELSRVQDTAQIATIKLSGRVYEGNFRDESTPFANVRVELRCSNDQKERGRLVGSATTNAEGWYELSLPSGCEFYNIVVTVPEGRIAAGADSVGGEVIDDIWIQYDYPLGKAVLTGNKFWIKRSLPEIPLTPLRPFVPITPQEPETVSCPHGCECMTEEMAKQEFGQYERCSPEICGYDDHRRPMYCFRPIEDVPLETECPEGCECLEEVAAAEKFGGYEWCSDEVCGFGEGRVPKYCFRPVEELPEEKACPEGCECLEEVVAAEKFGRYEWCSDEICGIGVGRVPKYCFRPVEDLIEECPEGCVCLSWKEFTETKGFTWCSNSTTCGYDEDGEPMRCYMPLDHVPEEPECPDGCECLAEEVAAKEFGRYERCSPAICGFGEGQSPMYCFRPIGPTPETGPESCELYFSTEEDFIAQGPIPPDGNPIISDGDLLGPGCVVFARNRELLAAFNADTDLGLDAVDVIDAEGRLVAFSTELDDPSGRFVAGDLLATNGLVISNGALLAEFDVARMDLGLDAVHFVGDLEDIKSFLDRSSKVSRDEWLKDPGILPEMLREYGVDIWFSTEGTPSWIDKPIFLDGDLLSAREGITVAPNSVLLPPAVPAGIPNRGVDFGLDAVTAGRDGRREQVRFSTEILYEGEPAFSDGDVILIGDGVTCTNWDLIRCFEPKTRDLGLDALSIGPSGEETRSPIEIYFADARESPGSVFHLGVIGGSEETIYTRPSRNLYSFAFHPYVPEKLYYVNANENKIYRSSETNTGWTREEVVYDHDTYVRDLAFDLDQDGDLVLYFSEATGAGADGKIYRIEDDAPVLYRTIVLSDVDGFWAGDFAFGEDGTLYLSSGNRVPASIYEVDEEGVREIFTDTEEPIKGLVYRDGFLYYANWGTKIYRLDLMTIERTTVYSNPERKWLSDVGFRGDTLEVPQESRLLTLAA
jgi:hypothetical protein